MVKSYNEYSNHNMRRPIVKPEIVGLMRGEQKALTGFLAEVETFAHAENIPVIPHETVVYFQFLLQALQPKKILEFRQLMLLDECFSKLQLANADRQPDLSLIHI